MRWPWQHLGQARADTDSWPDDSSDPVVGMLDRYAEGPLSPDPAELARIGATLRAAFVDAGLKPASQKAVPRSRAPYARRAFVAACTVALLTVSTAGFAAAESGPGEPFYRVRLGIEALFLPPAGSLDRIEADLQRAQARLDEAARASSSGNWNAEADAVGAYLDVVTSISMPQNPVDLESVRQRLAGQLAGLESLRDGPQGQAQTETRRAMERLDALMGEKPTPGASPTGGATQPTAAPSGKSGSTSGVGPPASPGSGAGQTSDNGGNQPSAGGGPSAPPQGPGEPGGTGRRSGS